MCQPQVTVTLITGRFLSLRRLAATVSRIVPVGVEVDQGTFMPDFSRLHTQILRVRYSEIQARNCWHCVRLLHRIMFATICSEAIAESAGSTLRFIEKKGSAGRSVKVPTLLEAVMLRFHGATGNLSTIPFLKAVIAEHWGDEDAAHFFVSARHRAKKLQGNLPLGPSTTTKRLRGAILNEKCMWSWLVRPVTAPNTVDAPVHDPRFSENLWQGLEGLLDVFT